MKLTQKSIFLKLCGQELAREFEKGKKMKKREQSNAPSEGMGQAPEWGNNSPGTFLFYSEGMGQAPEWVNNLPGTFL